MSSNSFGNIFKITTWGESHGSSLGVIVDGCPAGLPLSLDAINAALARRAPGTSAYVSPRKEQDEATIESGVFEGKTTGTPICISVKNKDADSSKYDAMKDLFRPGHANYTYLQKYGIFDHRGGGRASARETLCRVAAGTVAQSLLDKFGIKVQGYLASVGKLQFTLPASLEELRSNVLSSHIFAPNPEDEQKAENLIMDIKKSGDSIGGTVGFYITGVPAGLGEPIYQKLQAMLAFAMLGIPACKGFEFGEGFAASQMQGSEHNDPFSVNGNKVIMNSNHAGGILGGISTGTDIFGRVAFKPTPSIMQTQSTVTTNGQKIEFELPKGSRHDPCVAIRGVTVVEAMCQIVMADALLMHQARKI